MDLSDIARKLGLSEHKLLVRKAAELRRLCDVQFDSSIIGVGEVCKAVICLEIAATRFGEVIFDRQKAVKLSGMSEKAYNRSFNSLQNGLNIKWVSHIFLYLFLSFYLFGYKAKGFVHCNFLRKKIHKQYKATK